MLQIADSDYNRKNRDRLDIIENILLKTGNGCRKTRIMYGANLSTVQLRKYLEKLIKIESLNYSDEDRLYRVTQKGFKLLRYISEVNIAKKELKLAQTKLTGIMMADCTTKNDSTIDNYISNKTKKKIGIKQITLTNRNIIAH
jgi:predicted transcriptional regulator